MMTAPYVTKWRCPTSGPSNHFQPTQKEADKSARQPGDGGKEENRQKKAERLYGLAVLPHGDRTTDGNDQPDHERIFGECFGAHLSVAMVAAFA